MNLPACLGFPADMDAAFARRLFAAAIEGEQLPISNGSGYVRWSPGAGVGVWLVIRDQQFTGATYHFVGGARATRIEITARVDFDADNPWSAAFTAGSGSATKKRKKKERKSRAGIRSSSRCRTELMQRLLHMKAVYRSQFSRCGAPADPRRRSSRRISRRPAGCGRTFTLDRAVLFREILGDSQDGDMTFDEQMMRRGTRTTSA